MSPFWMSASMSRYGNPALIVTISVAPRYQRSSATDGREAPSSASGVALQVAKKMSRMTVRSRARPKVAARSAAARRQPTSKSAVSALRSCGDTALSSRCAATIDRLDDLLERRILDQQVAYLELVEECGDHALH